MFAAAAIAAACFGAVWVGTYTAGYGRDVHAVRVLASLGVMVFPAIMVASPRGKWPLRVTAIALALVVGLLAWWLIPAARGGGMNLLQASSKREAIRSQFGPVRYDDVKAAGQWRNSIDDLARLYPNLSGALRPEFERWGDDAARAVVEHFHDLPLTDIAAARTTQARGRTLAEVFPEHRVTIDVEFTEWMKRALLARKTELATLRPTDWDAFNRTAAGRHQLALALPDGREELISAERAWVTISAGEATEPALRALEDKPQEARRVCTAIEKQIRSLRSVKSPLEEFREARSHLFVTSHDAAMREVQNHIRAGEYQPAFTTALLHEQGWLKAPGLLSLNDKHGLADLREHARHLAIRFEKAGFVDSAPEPRGRDPAPVPRARPQNETMSQPLALSAMVITLANPALAAQPPATNDLAAERKQLDEALAHIRARKYVFAVARLAPLKSSQTLPAPVVKAIPGLVDDLRRLDALTQLSAAGEKLPVIAVDSLPDSVKRPLAWLELLRAVKVLLESQVAGGADFPWSAEKANKLLTSIGMEFGDETASRLRTELSAKLFLVSKPVDASKLLEDETPNEYAREVLADLRTIVAGGGMLVNPQIARFIPENGLKELPGAASLIPVSLRERWQRPKPPGAPETTLGKLDQRVVSDLSAATKDEMLKAQKSVTAAVEAIRAQMAKE